VLVGYDAESLVGVARDAGAVLVLVPRVGSFVRTGGLLVEVHGAGDTLDLVGHLEIEQERTTGRDLSYAMRQLVDIAARSLSPGDHDPTTSVQALDQLHELLAKLAVRRIGNGVYCDDLGDARLVTTPTTWETYVDLALDEVTRLGGSSAQVTRRLLELLEDLHGLAPDDRRAVLERRYLSVLDAAEEGASSGDDMMRASRPDRQGLGL
jgi:uncharacterized membrane protein